MRILCVGNMYPPHHLGGYELLWRSAVEHLRARGHEVAVLTTDLRRPGVAEDDDPGVHRELRWWWRDHEFPRRSPLARLRQERHNAAVLDRHLREPRPDVVGWWAMGGMSLSLIARAGRAGLPSVAVLQDEWLLYGPAVDQWTRAFARRPRLGAAVERATGLPARFEPERVDRWLFGSEFMRRRGLESGARLRATAIANSGIQASYLEPAVEREWGWRLLYAGRIDERKGLDVAVDALARLPAAATLTVVGDGDPGYLDRLRAHVRAAGLESRVRLEPGRDRAALRAVYDDHDVVVFPVRWDEPWGLVPLEAMARGRPVVATGTGGSAEYLRDGENALVVAPGDAAALAAALARLAGDPGLRARLRAGGRPTAATYTEARFNAAVADALEACARRAD